MELSSTNFVVATGGFFLNQSIAVLSIGARFAELDDVPVAVRNVAWVTVAVINRFFTRRTDTFGPLAIKLTPINRIFTRVTRCRFSGFH